LIGAIERGLVVDATLDVFESKWLPAMFQREREDVRAAHAALQVGVASPTTVEHSLVGKVGQQMLRRAIQLVRGARHGGLLLVVNSVPDGSPDLRGIRPKYWLAQDEPSHRYRTLLLDILRAVAETTSKASVGWADFASNESAHFAALEQDVFELSRVLANLTTNAIAHTPPGGRVDISAGVDGDLAWTRVDDTGPGIADADLPRIFEVAYRGTAVRSPAATDGIPPGSGLGLAIAAGLTQAHRGEITARNLDSGCRFEVRLPLAQ
jgi:anti-sigma regulatory factor (Ser/Thr protein kinase)